LTPTEGRVANSCQWWGRRRGTPSVSDMEQLWHSGHSPKSGELVQLPPWCSVWITWKPEYARPPHLFSLPHRANAVVENLGTEAPHLFFCSQITVAWRMCFTNSTRKNVRPKILQCFHITLGQRQHVLRVLSKGIFVFLCLTAFLLANKCYRLQNCFLYLLATWACWQETGTTSQEAGEGSCRRYCTSFCWIFAR